MVETSPRARLRRGRQVLMRTLPAVLVAQASSLCEGIDTQVERNSFLERERIALPCRRYFLIKLALTLSSDTGSKFTKGRRISMDSVVSTSRI